MLIFFLAIYQKCKIDFTYPIAENQSHSFERSDLRNKDFVRLKSWIEVLLQSLEKNNNFQLVYMGVQLDMWAKPHPRVQAWGISHAAFKWKRPNRCQVIVSFIALTN